MGDLSFRGNGQRVGAPPGSSSGGAYPLPQGHRVSTASNGEVVMVGTGPVRRGTPSAPVAQEAQAQDTPALAPTTPPTVPPEARAALERVLASPPPAPTGVVSSQAAPQGAALTPGASLAARLDGLVQRLDTLTERLGGVEEAVDALLSHPRLAELLRGPDAEAATPPPLEPAPAPPLAAVAMTSGGSESCG